MKKVLVGPVILLLVMLTGCGGDDPAQERTGALLAPPQQRAGDSQAARHDVKILQSWQGDYPVAQLGQFPANQRDHGTGYINDATEFGRIWKAFKPGEDVPDVDFQDNLVLFARNTRFYNRTSIGKVEVQDGVAEVLALETMSAQPIEDRVAMSLAVISRKGITAVRAGEMVVGIPD